MASRRGGVTVSNALDAAKLRAMALDLAIKCVPILASSHARPTAKDLMAEAEEIERWLRKAGSE